MSEPVILGIDPGLNSTGWALYSGDGPPMVGIIRPRSIPKKKRQKLGISQAQDDARRVEKLSMELMDVAKQADVVVIEGPAGSFRARSAVAMNLAFAAAVSTSWPFAFVEVVGVATLRRALTGRHDASKEEAHAELEWRGEIEAMLESQGIAKGQWEHVLDAACLVQAYRRAG